MPSLIPPIDSSQKVDLIGCLFPGYALGSDEQRTQPLLQNKCQMALCEEFRLKQSTECRHYLVLSHKPLLELVLTQFVPFSFRKITTSKSCLLRDKSFSSSTTQADSVKKSVRANPNKRCQFIIFSSMYKKKKAFLSLHSMTGG